MFTKPQIKLALLYLSGKINLQEAFYKLAKTLKAINDKLALLLAH